MNFFCYNIFFLSLSVYFFLLVFPLLILIIISSISNKNWRSHLQNNNKYHIWKCTHHSHCRVIVSRTYVCSVHTCACMSNVPWAVSVCSKEQKWHREWRIPAAPVDQLARASNSSRRVQHKLMSITR